MSTFTRTRRLLVTGCAALLASGLVAGCSDDDATTATTTTTATAEPSTTAPKADDPTTELEVTAVDYAFEGLPETIEAGSHLHLTNHSGTEVHEAVVFRVPDDQVDTPLEDLLAAAETDPEALGEFVGVSVALPGEEGVEPEGPTVFDEPGRYIVACFVPVGADVAAYEAALTTGEPPDAGDGMPHIGAGMVADVTVR